MNYKIFRFLLIIVLFLSSCGRKNKELIVFCGSANKPPMEKLVKDYQKKTGITVKLLFGGSGTLLSQIELSQRGDIYIPGSPDYIEIGNEKGLLIQNSEKIVAYLVLGIDVQAGNPKNIKRVQDLARSNIKVGIGNPSSVCLGLYSIEYLDKNKLLKKVLKNVRTFGGSCSKTANLISMKSVDAIIGWRVFSKWQPNKIEFIPFEPMSIPRISYIQISIPIYTHDRQLSENFIKFTLNEGKKYYKKFGYITDIIEAKKFAPNATLGGKYVLPSAYYKLIGIK